MSTLAPPLPIHSGPAPDTYLGVLDELIAMAMDVARLVHTEATHLATAQIDSGAEPEPRAKAIGVVAAAFDRAARTVRRTVTLANHLNEPVPDPHKTVQHDAARRQIIRKVQDTIQENACGERAEALRRELLERMDAPDIDEDIGHRPLIDIVNVIRQDLGLSGLFHSNQIARRTPEDIAELCAIAARRPLPLPLPPRRGPVSSPRHPVARPHGGTGPPSIVDDPATILLCNQLLGRA